MKHHYRICTKCGERWNVSSIGHNDKRYICPKCEQQIRAIELERRRIRMERRELARSVMTERETVSE